MLPYRSARGRFYCIFQEYDAIPSRKTRTPLSVSFSLRPGVVLSLARRSLFYSTRSFLCAHSVPSAAPATLYRPPCAYTLFHRSGEKFGTKSAATCFRNFTPRNINPSTFHSPKIKILIPMRAKFAYHDRSPKTPEFHVRMGRE